MHKLTRPRSRSKFQMKLLAAFFTACLLTACGGGGGGNDPAAVVACAPFLDSYGDPVTCAEMKALPGAELAYLEPGGGGGDGGSGDGGGDGSAGDGAPIANTLLRFTDINGKVVNTMTDARGRYRINLRGLQAPLVATVVRDNKPWKSMLVADIVRAPANRKFYTINLTGLTDFVVSEVAKKDGLLAGADAITPAAVARQKAQVPGIIKELNNTYGAQITTAGLDANNFDPLTKPFQAVLTDSYDKLLESLSVTRDPATGLTVVTPIFYTVGGSIAGLGGASGLTLVNGAETLPIAANATSFTLATKLAPGTNYDIKVGTQPVGLSCAVSSNGKGVVGNGAISNVAVNCSANSGTNSFTLGGTVAGLGNATGLQLSNGGQSVSIAPNQSSFVFANGLSPGASYSVTVQTQPAGLTCSVAGGAGTMGTAAVSNVAVTCVVNSYTLGGSVTGLSGGSLVLSSGGQTVSVAAGASSFVFPTMLASGLTYNVTVQTQPATVICSVSNGAGTVFAGPVSNVVVNCIPRTYTLGGSVKGLVAGGLLLLNAEQGLSVPANVIAFEFGAPLAAGSPYNVTVEAQPTGLVCSVANGSGTVVAANVTTVAVTCLPVGPLATVTTLAGNGKPGFSDGSGSAASFTQPRGVGVDASGNVYVADQLNHAIRKIGPRGLVSTLAGSGKPGFDDGDPGAASFNTPSGVAVDSIGNVYVADTQNHAIRMISPAGLVSTFAGNGTPGFVNGRGGAASFNNPIGIAVDSRDTLYVADSANHAIRAISQKGDVTTLAGTGKSGFVNGTGTAASFSGPTGIAVDSSGSVYVADLGNVVVRKINSAGVVSTLAGSGKFGFADGVGVAASFNGPAGVAVDSGGTVYVADAVNEAVRKISPAGVVTTLAGAGKGSAGFVNGTGVEARFSSPSGVAADSNGNVYVADVLNHAIRKIVP